MSGGLYPGFSLYLTLWCLFLIQRLAPGYQQRGNIQHSLRERDRWTLKHNRHARLGLATLDYARLHTHTNRTAVVVELRWPYFWDKIWGHFLFRGVKTLFDMIVNSTCAFIPISDLSVRAKTGDISGDSSCRGQDTEPGVVWSAWVEGTGGGFTARSRTASWRLYWSGMSSSARSVNEVFRSSVRRRVMDEMTPLTHQVSPLLSLSTQDNNTTSHSLSTQHNNTTCHSLWLLMPHCVHTV